MADRHEIDNAPNTALQSARRVWFENYGSAIVDKRRYFIFATAALAAVAALSVAIMVMLPLKTVTPYVITVDKTSGQASATDATAQVFKPGRAEQTYFLAQWATKLLTIDRYLSEKYLSEAYTLTRGQASQEFAAWIGQERPLERAVKDPSLSRVVNIGSVSFVQEGVAIIRVKSTTRSSQVAAQIKSQMITVHFSMVAPTSEREILENPIGIYITHFAINEDLT